MNVPAGSAFYLTILGNSLVVTCVKLLFSSLVFPPLALKLARFKYGVRGSDVITSCELAVRVHQTQVTTCAKPMHLTLHVFISGKFVPCLWVRDRISCTNDCCFSVGRIVPQVFGR